MSDSVGSAPVPPMKKKSKSILIAAVAVVIVIVVVAAAFMSGVFATNKQTELEKIKSQGKIVMWTEATFQPFETFDPATLTFSGFDIDLANRIAENVSADIGVNITLDINDKYFNTIPAALKANQIDMSLSGMTITALRNESVLFSVPYYTAQAGYGLMVKASEDRVANIDDVVNNNLKIVVNTGTTSEYWVQQHLTDAGRVDPSKITSLPTIGECVSYVQGGYADVFIIDKPTVDNYTETTHGAVKDAGVIPAYEPYGVAMPLGATDLKAIVDRVITNMIADGEMQALMEKWDLV